MIDTDDQKQVSRRNAVIGSFTMLVLMAGIGGSAYQSLKVEDSEPYTENGNICYDIADRDNDEEIVNFGFQDEDRDEEFQVLESKLEPDNDEGFKACASLDDSDLESYDHLAFIEYDGERVWEGSYSVS